MWIASHHGKYIKRDFLKFVNENSIENCITYMVQCVPEEYINRFCAENNISEII